MHEKAKIWSYVTRKKPKFPQSCISGTKSEIFVSFVRCRENWSIGKGYIFMVQNKTYIMRDPNFKLAAEENVGEVTWNDTFSFILD